MKKKNIAGILALFAGVFGVHRFYLGQIGWGIAYMLLIPFLLGDGFWIVGLLGVLDAVIFFSMDQDAFDNKYNLGAELQKNRHTRTSPQAKNRPSPKRNHHREASSKKSAAASRSKSSTFLKEGIKKFKDYDYEGAIEDFEQALKHDPQHVPTHFNLACAQSLMENKDKAFYHLDRAVALGFEDINAIKTRDHLAYLRIQDEFDQFEANGFRLAKQMSTPQENLLNDQPTKQSASQQPDLLKQLQFLAQLKEKGMLTEEEFSKQKEKLLR